MQRVSDARARANYVSSSLTSLIFIFVCPTFITNTDTTHIYRYAMFLDRARWSSGEESALRLEEQLGAAPRDVYVPTPNVAARVESEAHYYLLAPLCLWQTERRRTTTTSTGASSALRPPTLESIGDLYANRSRCPLARLFDSLLALCVDFNGRDTAHTTVINLVLDVFNVHIAGNIENKRARQLALEENARLAHCTIDVQPIDNFFFVFLLSFYSTFFCQ